jgi:23S rRNA pseudouridine2605 synthase
LVQPHFFFSAPPIRVTHVRSPPVSDTPTQPSTGDRLAKVIARSGLCSRRDAETWITAGRVTVNGKKVLTPAFNVTDRDKIMVDGAPLAARQGTRVWLYHKPAGLVVTEKDPEGRSTVFEAVEVLGLPRVVSVGRLDINTEGLLLLTNDGGLKRVLELPATGWLRRYRVRAHGSVTQAALDQLKDGIEVDGVRYGSIEATLEREQGSNVWMVMALREGKNREVKNVLGALGLEVNRLIRVSYGPFQLNDIPVGGIETVRAKVLRDQLGKKLADAADVDFESEMPEISQLVGKPTRERETGRGTNTVEIARQRFRFTDHAEKTEEEWRAERPRQDRPGRFDTRKPMARRPEPREEDMAPPRRIHFDEDGRAPEEFKQKNLGKRPGRPDPDEQPARNFGKRPERPAKTDRPAKKDWDAKSDRPTRGAKPAFGDRPAFGDKKPFGAKKPFGDRPHREEGDRPSRGFAERPRAGKPAGDRPRAPRRTDAPGAERPARSFAPRVRPDSERGAGAAVAPKRPGRNFSDNPKSFRTDGPRPPRAARPGRDELGPTSKTYGKPATRRDGKPHPKRDGAAPPRGGRPGGRPSGGAGRPAGKPGGGAGRPSGPRKPRG